MTVQLFHTLKSAARTLSAAVRAAGAVETGRQPRRPDLVVLGIDPTAFRDIGR